MEPTPCPVELSKSRLSRAAAAEIFPLSIQFLALPLQSPLPSRPGTPNFQHPSPGSEIKERSLAGRRHGRDGARARRSIDARGTYLWRIATGPWLRSPPPSPGSQRLFGRRGKPGPACPAEACSREIEKGWGQRVATRARYPGSGLCRPRWPLRRLGSTANFANCWPRCIPMCHGYPHDGDGRGLPSAPRRRNPAARCRLPHSTVAGLVRVLLPNPTPTHAATTPRLADI